MNNYITLGMILMQDIMKKKESSSGMKWSWERYIKGPLSDTDMNTITQIAGCWCYGKDADEVRFYTNQNHPRWR